MLFAHYLFQSLIGIIRSFNSISKLYLLFDYLFQSLIGIIRSFNVLDSNLMFSLKKFQSLIGIIRSFNCSPQNPYHIWFSRYICANLIQNTVSAAGVSRVQVNKIAQILIQKAFPELRQPQFGEKSLKPRQSKHFSH